MLLGALLAAGASPEWLEGLPARLGFPDVTIEIESVDRCGVQATKVNVWLPGGVQEHPSEVIEPHHHRHEAHARETHGPHRHIGDLIALVERAPLSRWVQERAVRAFQLLGEAEGRVHGMSADQVALHEVGAVDALVDIVGGIEGFEQLGITRVYNRPVSVGSGWVRAAHGALPVPAPATSILLEGYRGRAQRSGDRGGNDAHRRGAPSGTVGRRATGTLARGGCRGVGSGGAQPRELSQRAAPDPRLGRARGRRGRVAGHRPGRSQPGVSRPAA